MTPQPTRGDHARHDGATPVGSLPRPLLPRTWSRAVRRPWVAILGIGLIVTALTGLGAGPATAETVCSPGGDSCTVEPDIVQTPLGQATLTVTAGNVVTVHLDPNAPNTVVIGIPFPLPPAALGLVCPGGCTRTNIDTPGGLVSIDTIVFPPGPPARPAQLNVAIVSIHPPNPCRAATTGTTVTFTPIFPPRTTGLNQQSTADRGGSRTGRGTPECRDSRRTTKL